MTIIQAGTGAVHFLASEGATVINRQSFFYTAGQYAVANATVIAANVWLISGDLAVS